MNGMMQFFYTNKIDFTEDNFLEIKSSGEKLKNAKAIIRNQKVLIPVGGGKDSAVTLGVLKDEGQDMGSLVIEKATFASHTVSKISTNKNIVIERNLDMFKLIDLNKIGFLNGHIPYSASLYFISLLAAYVFDYQHIVFSNENSSNESNVTYLGKEVNHQYSKTLEFENDFSKYNWKYLSNIDLFSFLRPLFEIQISKIFSKYTDYYSVIRSCNKGQKDGTWCGVCSKCLSTYILLFPFLGENNCIKIFSRNVLGDKNLIELLTELIDENKVKPFECVGTRLELKVALNMAIKLYKNDKPPVLLQWFIDSKLYDPEILNIEQEKIMNSFGKNNLPLEFKKILKANL